MQYISHIDTVLSLIPENKVVSYATLAKIFFVSPIRIKGYINSSNHPNTYKVIPSTGKVAKTSIKKLQGDGFVLHNSKVSQHYFRKPQTTNYYISLLPNHQSSIEEFVLLSKKLSLLHPNTIFKIPTQYHITLADCSNTTLTQEKIDAIFSETFGLLPFHFHCILHKPYIDTKKQKVVFWIRLQNNPFLLTLHYALQKHIPRRSEKKYLPHITLGKILKTTKYSPKVTSLSLDTMCMFDRLCITANIDSTKDIILFSKTLQ